MIIAIALPILTIIFLFLFGQINDIFDIILLFTLYFVGYSIKDLNKIVVAVAGLVSYAIFAVLYNLSFLTFLGSIFFFSWLFILFGMISPEIEKKINELKNQKTIEN